MAFKIAFLGSPVFAAKHLEALLQSGAALAGVITAPDKPKGRSLALQPTPVRLLAEKAGLSVLTPTNINHPDVLAVLRSWEVNVIVLVAFGQILKDAVLDLPPLGCINVHPSLLPLYRGAAPMQRAIMDGKTETGVTICKMARPLDSGDILLARQEPIRPEDTYGTLHDRLAAMGCDLLIEALKDLASGRAKAVPQDHAQATFAPKIKKEDERIAWSKPAVSIRDLIRALNPAPGASAVLRRGKEQETVKIWSAREGDASSGASPGDILQADAQGLRVAAGKGSLWIDEIQPASKAKMPIAAWLSGHKIRKGDTFEQKQLFCPRRGRHHCR